MSFQTTKKPTIVSLEGNIGVGKSTLVRYLKSQKFNKNIIFIEEPVDVWNTIKDNENKTALEYFYENKTKYSFSFQMMAFISRLSLVKKTIEQNPNAIVFMERSLQTDKNVFEKMLYEDKHINIIEHQIYDKWFEEFGELAKLTHIIYLSSTPQTSFARVQNRSRNGENNITIDYLTKCHDYHNKWIMNFDTPTLIIDGNVDFQTDIKYFKNSCQDIMSFLELTKSLTDDTLWLTGC